MLAYIRRYQKGISIFLLLNFVNTIGIPTESFALTSGPSQPETQQFAPAGMDNMVDPFTGDFSYNIPLMDVGGYPININYSAGITPDQEASWVGLGWNLNVGAINRSVRGIPDDFAGDEITTEHTMKPNQTFGLTFSPGNEMEIFTIKPGLASNVNVSYNTYNGFAFSVSYSPSFDLLSMSNKSDSKFKLGLDLEPSISLSIGSEDGVGISPSIGLKTTAGKNDREGTLNARIGFPFSSREGAKGMSLSTSFNYETGTKYHGIGDKIESGDPNKNSTGFGGSAFKGFSTPTYTTQIEHDVYAVNATLNISPEKLEYMVKDKTMFLLGGFYHGQFSKTTEDKNPAYGYMYEGITDDPKSVLDFNREKDAGYNEKTTNMPVTNHTYDIFSVQGEGVGGTYRLYRNDVATVGDNEHTDESISPDLKVSGGFNPMDITGMTDIKLGLDFKYIHSQSTAGRWFSDRVQHQVSPYDEVNKIPENIYFGRIGDPAPENQQDYYNNTLLADALYKYNLEGGVVTGHYLKNDLSKDYFNKNGNSDYLRTKRRHRTSSFSYLVASKADKFAVSPIFSYDYRDFDIDMSQPRSRRDQPLVYKKTPVPRVGGERKGHHISEVRVANNSGSRYIYGTPVYNKVQHDVNFSVNVSENGNPSLETVRKDGLVKYNKDTDPTLRNKNGLEHYYKRTITEGSASSYLLNYILSSDYVDSDAIQGPSDGDLGTYVKFNYARTSNNYQWRSPFQENTANFADGLAGKREDDKASYSYGSKELWYVHSIETRTHVAEFHMDYRMDGLGVKDQHGGLVSGNFDEISDESKLMYIKKIVLYAKADKLNGRQEPLKTVHFDYDYSLCPGTPNSLALPIDGIANSGKGKLTLKKVWFTYGLSNKGVLNPYVFHYADTDFNGSMETNFPYNSKNYDRWGVYKTQDLNIGNEAFPYTVQDKAQTDLYAAAYAITKINTPTGGEMRVHYESDDYGYVQNHKAMRMYTIKGVSSEIDDLSSVSNQLYGGGDNLTENRYLYIDLKEGFKAANLDDAKQYFINNYLGDINELHYKISLGVFGSSRETLPGYCTFIKDEASINVIKDPNNTEFYRYGVIMLNPEALNRGTANVHPFVKNGWLFARLHYNRELMGSANAEDNGFLQVVGSIASSLTSVLEFFMGFRLYMKTSGHSKHFTENESFVRLYEHDLKKLGGGHRVKAIVMLDRWDDMKSDREKSTSGVTPKEEAGYGQVYDYTIPEDPANSSSRSISAGVAAYEPIIGGEENPIRKLVKTTDNVPLAPDKEYYSETPYGESFYPAPSVGYRKVRTTPVKVVNNAYTLSGLSSNGTGYVEQEFYTAKEFPTYVTQTPLQPFRQKSSQLNPLKINSFDYVSCSQGYLIELNDMHGKPKSTKVMPDAASGTSIPISYITYLYKTKNGDPSRLDNTVPLVDSTLAVTTIPGQEIGTTVDVVNDTRYHNNLTSGGGADINGKISFPKPPIFFVPQISFFPDVNFETTMFSSITTTKVVNRHGVLVKTIAQDNGQSITTENLVWDKKTGEVLLTKVENEYHEPLFSFSYPGHWVYPEMGLSSKNEGFRFNTLNGYLIDGDEVICASEASVDTAYYDAVANKLLRKNGTEVTSYTWAQVVRSGARNVAMTPVASVSTLTNPLVGNKIQFDGAQVLNAGAAEFKHVWKGFCNCGEQSNEVRNPFITGQRGQLRPWRNWTYLTERIQKSVNGELQVRKDGYFTDYTDFWKPFDGALTPYYLLPEPEKKKWQYVTEIENYNPLGMEIENKDALERYSMAQFGYGRNLPVATSNNSRYQETGFDGFEDYEYGDCNDDHFSWRVRKDDPGHGLVNTEAHTGKQSFKVPARSSSKIVKIIDPCEEQ